MAGLPLAVAPALGTPRFVPLATASMEPGLRMGTMLLVVPVDAWHGAGLYLLDRPPTPDVWRCRRLTGGALRLEQDRPGSDVRTVTADEFAADVVGLIAGTVRVFQPDALGV